MGIPREYKGGNRSTEGIWDMDVWKRLNSETNDEQLNRLKANLKIAIRDELTPRQQQILSMHFFQGLSVTDIAQDLGINPSTVSRSLKRAKIRLQKALKYSF